MESITEHGTHPNHIDPQSVGIPTTSVPFRAVLTATSNPYLTDRLPLTGYVKVLERDIYGGVQPGGLLFMPDPEPGKRTSYVEVRDAVVEFRTR